MKKNICYFLISVLLICQSLSASEIVYNEKSSPEKEFKAFTQLNIACGYRSDERSSLNHSPTYKATFYSMFSQYVGMKFGVGVNLSTKRPNSYHYTYSKTKEIQLESGFRFQNQLSTFAPFAELGISVISYSNLPFEGEELKGGVFVVFGMEYIVQDNFGIEFSFRQILNNSPENVVFIAPAPDDPPNFYYPPDNDSFFNPTSFNFGVNLKFK